MKAFLSKGSILSGLLLGLLFHPPFLRAVLPLTPQQARQGAAKGDADAEFQLGKFYDEGNGVPQDYAKAAELYRKAAEQGFGKAEHNLAMLYLQGQGVKKDQDEAIKWLKKAAAQGLLKSQAVLGAVLAGQGDASHGIDLLLQTAEEGNAAAQVQLGNLYYFGDHGFQREYAKAAKWYLAAANQGNPIGENAYGVMKENGSGMPVDRKAAMDWFRKAAEQGDPKGESNYGRMFASNLPEVESSPGKAYFWLSLSAAQGEVTAKNFFESYAGSMKPEEIAKGKGLLQEYNAQHGTHITAPAPGNFPW